MFIFKRWQNVFKLEGSKGMTIVASVFIFGIFLSHCCARQCVLSRPRMKTLLLSAASLPLSEEVVFLRLAAGVPFLPELLDYVFYCILIYLLIYKFLTRETNIDTFIPLNKWVRTNENGCLCVFVCPFQPHFESLFLVKNFYSLTWMMQTTKLVKLTFPWL